jgi:hypothetical protein
LPEAEFPERGGDGIDRPVVDPGIAVVWLDGINVSQFNFHGNFW